MLNCEQAQIGLSKILEGIPEKYWIEVHGSFRYPVYPGWKTTLQNNDDLHLLFVWGGDGCYYMMDKTIISLQKGTLVFISHGTPHYATINSNNPVKIAGLRFGLYDRSGCDVTKEAAPNFYYSFNFNNYHEIDAITWKIHQFFHKKKDSISLKATSMMVYQILNELYQSFLNGFPQKNKDNSKLEMIRQYIEVQAFRKINVQRLAKENGISARYLQKLFKEAYSFTPKEYHLNIQMNIAHTLLTQNSLSVTKTADILGYCDAFSFSKQFKKHFGYPPSQAI